MNRCLADSSLVLWRLPGRFGWGDRMKDEEKDLFAAIEAGDTEKVLELLKSGIDINCHDATGMSPLATAAYRGNFEIAKLCIEKGGDVNDKQHTQSYTPLMFAALAGKPDLCKLLMDHGARSYCTNSIGKTASELAAFVGQHECVSIINNHVTIDEIERLLSPKVGSESTEVYPEHLARLIHKLCSWHQIHPVAVAFELSKYGDAMKYQKKILYVVDRVFEKQLRCKEGNEVMSLKLWVILFVLRDAYKYVSELVLNGRNSHESCLIYAKHLLSWEPGEQVRKNLEILLRNAMKAFPYHHSLLYETLVKAMAKTSFGERPTAFEYIVQGLFGQRLLMASKFCATCGSCSAKKRCPKCKLCYCSVECQKFDWPIHKSCCESIRSWNNVTDVRDTISLEDLQATIAEIDQ
ncbi:MYND finger [Necator americanus]|uniref:MYND finger n=2 Tax=Necator americanus TaxID=51031 RepID=W2TG06_NECAM|nr:MYND finger [Necator americanus]ETN80126.1 MYND finger [Necator americanus]